MNNLDENGLEHVYDARLASASDVASTSIAYCFGDSKDRIGFDALLVHFSVEDKQWIGSFRNDRGSLCTISPTGMSTECCVIANGAGYIVSVVEPTNYKSVPVLPISGIVADLTTGLLIFHDYQEAVAFRGMQEVWRTRIFGDELSFISRENGFIICQGYEPGIGVIRKRLSVVSGKLV